MYILQRFKQDFAKVLEYMAVCYSLVMASIIAYEARAISMSDSLMKSSCYIY